MCKLRYEVKISEIQEVPDNSTGIPVLIPDRMIFTQVVDTNPLKAVSKAINNTRVRKPKETAVTTDKKGKLL